jgi:hypothetical protein
MPEFFYSAQRKVAADGVDWPPHISMVNEIENTNNAIEKRVTVLYSFLADFKMLGKLIHHSFG